MKTLDTLYGEVDRRAEALTEVHAARMQCKRGCADCCIDGLTVFELEADNIRHKAAEVLKQAPGPAGGCAFLAPDKSCRIYEARPYVCRTQGLPLRWLDEDPSGLSELVEYRDICPLNEPGGPALEVLDEEGCYTIGPFEGALFELARQHQKSTPTRVLLRSLFCSTRP